MQYDGSIGSTVAVGVSPGHLALDIRTSTGIPQLANNALFLAPNPTTEQLRIGGISTAMAEIRIFDATGRSVFTGYTAAPSGQAQLDVTGLRSGFYTVQVNRGSSIRFMKH